MTAGYNHLGKSDACFHLLGAVGEAHVKVTPTETMKGLCPPVEWLRILFEGAEFPPSLGMYYMPQKPEEIIVPDQHVLRVTSCVRQRPKVSVGFPLRKSAFNAQAQALGIGQGDIDSRRMVVRVCQGKDRKERYVMQMRDFDKGRGAG